MPKSAILIGLLLVSVYLTLTRQVMIACVLAIFLSMFMGKKKLNFTAIILGLLFIGGLYVYYDVLFSSLAEQTRYDSDEDNVRLLAAAEFWAESIKSLLTFLLGYGLPDASSAYGAHIMHNFVYSMAFIHLMLVLLDKFSSEDFCMFVYVVIC